MATMMSYIICNGIAIDSYMQSLHAMLQYIVMATTNVYNDDFASQIIRLYGLPAMQSVYIYKI